MRRQFLTTLILVIAICGVHAICDPAIRLNVRPQSGFGKQTVRIEVRIQPLATDRVLAVELDNGLYFRHTEIPLDGENAAKLQSFTWRDIPAGVYEVVAVIGPWSGPRARATQHVTFLPID